jgi:Raf kinase inhibitor-like YbhB/YbcL family protein
MILTYIVIRLHNVRRFGRKRQIPIKITLELSSVFEMITVNGSLESGRFGMSGILNVIVQGIANRQPIPEKFAFCAPCADNHVKMSTNISPAITWTGAPAGTKSFAILCVDPDVPSKPDDVNQEGKTIPADLTRVDFYHWVLVDIDGTSSGLPEGADSDGVTPKGKDTGPTDHGVRGINNYTDWFAGDEDMGGDYGGYDGPCPPWNDSIIHHYHFKVFALDVESLGLSDCFGGPEAFAAMTGHILAMGEIVGTYTQNPDLA